nr:hypothetical protein Iba_chr06aCG0780 [Ipomoea batatas]GMD07093.1 hypothetical protein Iba_chr06cCG3880 [Ipomoea batatas]
MQVLLKLRKHTMSRQGQYTQTKILGIQKLLTISRCLERLIRS